MHLSKTSWLQEEYVVPELLHLMVDRKEEKGRGVTQTETDRQEGRNKTQPQGQAPVSYFLQLPCLLQFLGSQSGESR